jgi:arylformamidase
MPRIIDLTLAFAPGMRGFTSEPRCTVARDGWNASTLAFYSHAGTHMDSQIHFEAGPETLDQIPLERCLGPAWLVNLAGIAPGTLIEVSHLGVVADQFQPGDSLLLRTDWSRHAGDPGIYRNQLPRIGEGLARWCVERGAKMLGVEPPSVADVNNLAEVTLIHKILLGGGVNIVEGLTNLDALAPGEEVFFAALPLKIAGGDGCPCRAFAFKGSPRDFLGEHNGL